MSTEEIILLVTATVGAVASAIVTIANGVKVKKQLEVIHRDTNGNLGEVKRELMFVREQLRRERQK